MTIYSLDIYILEQIKQIQQITSSLRFSSLAISQSHALEEVCLNTKCFMRMQIFCIAFRNRHALTRTLYKLVQLGTSCQCAATPWYTSSQSAGTPWYNLPP